MLRLLLLSSSVSWPAGTVVTNFVVLLDLVVSLSTKGSNCKETGRERSAVSGLSAYKTFTLY